MTTTDIIRSYTNGNYNITLYEDGTKVRATKYNEFIPKFPESIDVKITNKCNLHCNYCHEESHSGGAHCEYDTLIDNLKCLPKGVELALGGGNPLDHPRLKDILYHLNALGLICNMTVNAEHLCPIPENVDYIKQVNYYLDRDLIKGLGLSWTQWDKDSWFFKHKSTNIVPHLIAGIHSIGEMQHAINRYGKILILGYKQFGRGRNWFSKEVEYDLSIIKNKLWTLLGTGVVSFDNLAIKQLDIRSHLDKKQWDEFYMGDDGNFTMYYDAVKNQYAISSISDRVNVKTDVIDFFKTIC